MEWHSVSYGANVITYIPLHYGYCKAQPTMYSYPMPEEYLLPFNEIEGNLTGTQGVWSLRECYVSKIRDCEENHQLPPTSPVGFLYKRTRLIEDVPQHPVDVRGQRGSYFRCGQHSIKWCDGNSQLVDLTRAVELGQGKDQDETQARSYTVRASGVQDMKCVSKLWLSSPCSL